MKAIIIAALTITGVYYSVMEEVMAFNKCLETMSSDTCQHEMNR